VVTARRLNRYEVIQIRRLSSIENFVSERDDFIFNSFRNFKPVKGFENMSDVLEFWSLDNSSSKSILDADAVKPHIAKPRPKLSVPRPGGEGQRHPPRLLLSRPR